MEFHWEVQGTPEGRPSLIDIFQANSLFSFYGDDEIVSTDIKLDPEKLTAKLKEYGLKPTRPDKN